MLGLVCICFGSATASMGLRWVHSSMGNVGILLELLKLVNIKGLVPADIDENLDASIQLQQ